MKKLVLIDSNAVIHRAYHALPQNMSNSKGEMTNAVYGYTTTLIKVLEDLQPDYIAAAFDVSKTTFRTEHYAEYKANRVKADQELYDQIPRVKELLDRLNIPIYEMDGYEADDCIGTIASRISNFEFRISNQISNPNSQNSSHSERSEESQDPSALPQDDNIEEIQIYIVTGDKDLFQLVNGNIFVYSLKKGLSQTEIVDHKKINEEYNLDPEDFIDLKALAGDPSDNIPGVPGIGPKTATELLINFDSLQNLYGSIAKLLNCSINNLTIQQFSNEMVESIAKELKLKPRIVRLLLENREQAFMSQKLATIHKEVPIEFNIEDCRFGEYDKDKLKEFFEELGFRSLLKRFGASEEENIKPKTETAKKDQQLKLL